MTKRPKDRNTGVDHVRGERGAALVEFALVFSVLMSILLGIVSFGVAYSNYLTLTNATTSGAQLLSVSRGPTTGDLCSTIDQTIVSSAPNLNQSNLGFSLVLTNSGTQLGSWSSPSCPTAYGLLAPKQTAELTVTYPCNLKFFGFNPAAGSRPQSPR